MNCASIAENEGLSWDGLVKATGGVSTPESAAKAGGGTAKKRGLETLKAWAEIAEIKGAKRRTPKPRAEKQHIPTVQTSTKTYVTERARRTHPRDMGPLFGGVS